MKIVVSWMFDMIDSNISLATVLYHVAEDFIKLSYTQKFHIGLELKILFNGTTFIHERQLETFIFTQMYKRNKLEEFSQLVFKVMNE